MTQIQSDFSALLLVFIQGEVGSKSGSLLLQDPRLTTRLEHLQWNTKVTLTVCLHQNLCYGRQNYLVASGRTCTSVGGAAAGRDLKTPEDTYWNRRSSESQRRHLAARRRPETGECCSLQQGAIEPCGADKERM